MKRDPYLAGLHYQVSLDRLFTAQEVDEFIALYQTPETTESALHTFFRSNPKFLYLLGAYSEVQSEVSFRGKVEKTTDRHDYFRLDFLVKHYQNVWDVVELKKPTLSAGRLVAGPPIRPRFVYELQDAVAQVRIYLDQLAQEEVQAELKTKGIVICRPKAWIIAGRNDNVSIDEKRFLEESLPHSIQLLTYDDLAELSKRHALIVTRSIQSPLITTLEREKSNKDSPESELHSRSSEEIAKALSSLSVPDLLRLQRYAKDRVVMLGSNTRGRDGNDLLQEAIVATVDGTLLWGKDVSFVQHMSNAMRRISQTWLQSRAEGSHGSEIGDDLGSFEPKTNIDPERTLNAKERLEQIQRLFAEDAAASTVVEFLGLGYTSKEIQSRLAISSEELTVVMRRIRRQVQTMH